MPLPMKTLRQVSTELGMPEAEIRTLVQLGKIRALMKRGVLMFAPDEIAKIKRERKTIPDSAKKAGAPEPAVATKPATPVTPKVAAPKVTPPKRPLPPRKFGT